jgi:EVE domain
MKSWFCSVKAGNWNIMKREGLFGVNSQGRRHLSRVRPNDLLVIYSRGLDAGVVGICKVVSRPFVERRVVWPEGYPHRVRIEVILDRSSSPLTMSKIFGGRNSGAEVTPYMLGSPMIEVRPSQKVASFLKEARRQPLSEPRRKR